MDRWKIIQKTADFIALEFASECSGHDWFHIDRVRKLSILIGQAERSNLFVTEMAALLHDLDDWKLTGSELKVPAEARKWLIALEVE